MDYNDWKDKKTNHSTSGLGVPMTSASRRIVLPSLPSASRNFLRNSGGVDAFASLIYQNSISILKYQKKTKTFLYSS
jgi:hypothetical protein